MKAKRALALGVPMDGKRPPAAKVAVAYVVHEDADFLAESIRSFSSAGQVYVFVSTVPWRGEVGNYQASIAAAEAAGAKVIVGTWADEKSHRVASLLHLKKLGYTHAIIPDGDEIGETLLIDSLVFFAKSWRVQRAYVTMNTYWRDPDLLIQPRERLMPLLMVEIGAITAVENQPFNGRLFTGGAGLHLEERFGVLHHLSYVGSEMRIRQKLASTSHSHEIIKDWLEDVYIPSEGDPLVRNFHPTHKEAYGFTVRIHRPPCLRNIPLYHDPFPDSVRPEDWPSVSIVIPLYGGEEDIRLNLSSLETCDDLFDELFVVDDVSPDSAAEVAKGFSRVTLLRNEKNSGFAATCNKGLVECSGEVVIFLNSDCVVDRWGLIRLVESLMRTESIGAAGPYTNNSGYGQAIFCTYPDLNHLGLFCRDFAHRDAADKDVPMLVGFCLAVKRSVLKKIGGFNTEFGRGMFEDNELVYRIQRAEYRCVLSGRSFIHHTGSRSLARVAEDLTVLLERNKRKYHEMWHEDVECGFPSHLPGQSAEPIVFRPERRPDVLRKELERLRSGKVAWRYGVGSCLHRAVFDAQSAFPSGSSTGWRNRKPLEA